MPLSSNTAYRRLVLSKLEKKGMSCKPDADRRFAASRVNRLIHQTDSNPPCVGMLLLWLLLGEDSPGNAVRRGFRGNIRNREIAGRNTERRKMDLQAKLYALTFGTGGAPKNRTETAPNGQSRE